MREFVEMRFSCEVIAVDARRDRSLDAAEESEAWNSTFSFGME